MLLLVAVLSVLVFVAVFVEGCWFWVSGAKGKSLKWLGESSNSCAGRAEGNGPAVSEFRIALPPRARHGDLSYRSPFFN